MTVGIFSYPPLPRYIIAPLNMSRFISSRQVIPMAGSLDRANLLKILAGIRVNATCEVTV